MDKTVKKCTSCNEWVEFERVPLGNDVGFRCRNCWAHYSRAEHDALKEDTVHAPAATNR